MSMCKAAMESKFDQLVRREQRKSRLIKLCTLVMIGLFFYLAYIYSSTEPDSTVLVVGSVKNHHVELREDGHRTYLFVEIPDGKKLVKVWLPSGHPIKKGVHVELVQQSTSVGHKRYKFLRYKDE